jgi:hypothetical protein
MAQDIFVLRSFSSQVLLSTMSIKLRIAAHLERALNDESRTIRLNGRDVPTNLANIARAVSEYEGKGKSSALNYQNIQQWRDADSSPKLERLPALAKVLGLTLAQLILDPDEVPDLHDAAYIELGKLWPNIDEHDQQSLLSLARTVAGKKRKSQPK